MLDLAKNNETLNCDTYHDSKIKFKGHFLKPEPFIDNFWGLNYRYLVHLITCARTCDTDSPYWLQSLEQKSSRRGGGSS